MTGSRSRKPRQDRKQEPRRNPGQNRGRDRARAPAAASGRHLLWGWHAVSMAVRNDRRQVSGLICTARTQAELAKLLAELPGARRGALPEPVLREREVLDSLAGEGAVHQGILAEVLPLPDVMLEDITEGAGERAVLVLLDQVTDPHNVGAILRSAAAFGADAVITTERNAAPVTGVLAKSASGALDAVDLVHVTNLARTMERLREAGFWCVGLDGTAEDTIDKADLGGRIAVVMGAEGSGLRRLTRMHCDLLVRLPTSGPVATLNVSAATAATLYEIARQAPR